MYEFEFMKDYSFNRHIEPGEKATIRILDATPFKKFYYVHSHKPDFNEMILRPELCEKAEDRYHMPIVHDGEPKILSMRGATYKQLMRKVEEIERERKYWEGLALSQKEAARRFKLSRMQYDRKK
jgi:cell wall assembly regulator SMI1